MQISDIRVYFSQILTYVKGLRDGMGREVGGGVQDGEHMYTHEKKKLNARHLFILQSNKQIVRHLHYTASL